MHALAFAVFPGYLFCFQHNGTGCVHSIPSIVFSATMGNRDHVSQSVVLLATGSR